MVSFVGLDLGKHKAHACVLDQDGREVKLYELGVSREELERFAGLIPAASRIALETSTNAYAVWKLLSAAGHQAVISNPLLTKAIAAAKVKTDKVDARVLAHLLRTGYLPTVWVPDQETHEVRTLCGHRASLVRTRTKFKNKVHSILARHLITHPFSDLFGKAGREWLTTVALPAYERIQMQTCLAMLQALDTQVATIEQELAQRASREPWNKPVRLLITIPGVDVFGSMTLLSAIGDVKRFDAPKKLSGYFGVTSSVYQSGQSQYHGRITKRGNPIARWALVQSARIMVKVDAPMQAFYGKIKARKGTNVAVVAVARKLTVFIWHMLTKETTYLYERPMLTRDKLARMRLKATGVRLKPGAKVQTKTSSPSLVLEGDKSAPPRSLGNVARLVDRPRARSAGNEPLKRKRRPTRRESSAEKLQEDSLS